VSRYSVGLMDYQVDYAQPGCVSIQVERRHFQNTQGIFQGILLCKMPANTFVNRLARDNARIVSIIAKFLPQVVQNKNLRFESTGITTFEERPEPYSLYALCKSLLNPNVGWTAFECEIVGSQDKKG